MCPHTSFTALVFASSQSSSLMERDEGVEKYDGWFHPNQGHIRGDFSPPTPVIYGGLNTRVWSCTGGNGLLRVRL